MPDDRGTPDAPETHLGLKKMELGLPARWYYDQAQYSYEMTNIWEKGWIYVCHESALPDPLTYRTFEIGDQNIVIVRGSDGALRAFHNACPHRGSILCKERQGKLKSKLVVCPYHQWSFAADSGKLAAITSFEEPEGFDKADHGLFPVAMGVSRGFIFIHLDPDAVWPGDQAVELDSPRLKNYPMENLVIGHTWRSVMNCNWKTFWENFLECLHCPEIHPELGALVPIYGKRLMSLEEARGWEELKDSDDPRDIGGLKKGAETWSMDGSAQNRTFKELADADKVIGFDYSTTYPSVFVGCYADHLRAVRLVPLGPEKTELVAEFLFEPETLADPDYDIANVVDFAILVMQQDIDACDLNQRGLHAKPMKRTVLMPEEYYVKNFHDWVRGMLDQSSS